jgi:prolyl-tRNA editing enzyme YbaK/EbsC (Cys-tRNA(Pro) deacylase)
VRSVTDVHNFLLEEGVAHEVIHLPALSKTAERAAELLGVPRAEVVKSLLFYLDGEPSLVLVTGASVVDPGLLCAASGCAQAALARGQQVLDVTGYRAGAVPPCALATPLPVIADRVVFEPPVVYCGGGSPTTLLTLRRADLFARLHPRRAATAAPAAR